MKTNNKLYLKSVGIRGCSYDWKEKGEIIAFIDGERDYISIDAFEGLGDTYKRRENCFIEIKINGIFYPFENLKELEEQLKK